MGRTLDEHRQLEAMFEAAEAALQTRKDIVVDSGCVWEGPHWRIAFEVVIVEDPCRHCRHFLPKPGWNYPSGNSWDDPTWVCPRVVVAENEGGCATTGVCLDCILEKAKELTV